MSVFKGFSGRTLRNAFGKKHQKKKITGKHQNQKTNWKVKTKNIKTNRTKITRRKKKHTINNKQRTKNVKTNQKKSDLGKLLFFLFSDIFDLIFFGFWLLGLIFSVLNRRHTFSILHVIWVKCIWFGVRLSDWLIFLWQGKFYTLLLMSIVKIIFVVYHISANIDICQRYIL